MIDEFDDGCPFCGQSACGHLLAVIDETFQEVSGPADSLFGELACSDEDEGLTSDDVQAFIDACFEVGTLGSSIVHDDMPGQSVRIHTFYASDVVSACETLRQMLLAQRGNPEK